MITDGKLSMEPVTLTPDQDGALQWPGARINKKRRGLLLAVEVCGYFFLYHALWV